MSKTTICICTYNNHELLLLCIKSLFVQSIDKINYEVLILDNSSGNVSNKEKLNECKKLCDLHGFNYLEEYANGLSDARNICIRKTTTEIIHFIDDDTIVDFNFVENTIKIFEFPSVTVVGGKILPDWRLVKRPDWLSDEHLGFMSMLDFGDIEINRLQKDFYGFYLVGANIAFRRTIFDKVGLFDTGLGRNAKTSTLMGQEENELISRIPAEYDVIYSHKIKLNHIVVPSKVDKNWFFKRIAWQAVNDVMTNNVWLKNKRGKKDHIFENLSKLITDSDEVDHFSDKLEMIHYIFFNILYSGDVNCGEQYNKLNNLNSDYRPNRNKSGNKIFLTSHQIKRGFRKIK